MRPDASIPKVTVIVTDGYSYGRPVAEPAKKLRDKGVNIFSIGVGNNVNPRELNTMATDPDSTHVFRLDSFDDLAGWVDKLSAVSCDGECTVIFDFLINTVDKYDNLCIVPLRPLWYGPLMPCGVRFCPCAVLNNNRSNSLRTCCIYK